MSFNWNVYKIFKNGKRAKAPVHQFEFKGLKSDVYDYFKANEIENIASKVLLYEILNDSENQNRITKDDKDEKISKQKNRVLAKLIRQKSIDTNKRYGAGLILSKESNWKWQWAILEVATNRYLQGLSPQFKSYEEANNWMNQEIETLSAGT